MSAADVWSLGVPAGGDRIQGPSDSTEIPEPEEDGRGDSADSPGTDGPAPGPGLDSSPSSTVIAEVLPGVAVVCGEVPTELEPDLIDFGIVPAADRKQISAVLASLGNAATVAGNLGHAFASVQGLYRLGDATQALLNSGAKLAVKDGANLGAVTLPGRILRQARLYPVNAVSKAQTAASIGRIDDDPGHGTRRTATASPYGHPVGQQERGHRRELGESDRFRGRDLRRRVGPSAAVLGHPACPFRVRAGSGRVHPGHDSA
ncbi:hypothetical protein [Streptomyces sp. NPDC014623]|uniref:hypothetical protein n=1 Tax=Streptomyces sp. NPDC014623 TaxID=3364875 RepID=UPI0036F988C7